MIGIFIAITIWLVIGFIGALINFKFDKLFREGTLTPVVMCVIIGLIGLGIGFYAWSDYRHQNPKIKKVTKHYTLTRTYAFMSRFVKPEGE